MHSSQEIATPLVSSPDNILGLNDADRSSVPEDLLSFNDKPIDMTTLRNKEWCQTLISFVRSNPRIDFVIRLDLPTYNDENTTAVGFQGFKSLSALPTDTGKGIFVGGSGPLHWLMSHIRGYNKVKWNSSDVDIFFLGCPENTRMACAPGNVDMVFCKDKTIEEVLLNFDLPCCRVGYDFKYNYYVSIQALVAIMTGKMYLPHFMGSNLLFQEKLNNYKVIHKSSFGGEVNRLIIRRFYERVKKYESRGIKTVYCKFDYMLPWVKNRFTYVDFSVDETPTISQVVNLTLEQLQARGEDCYSWVVYNVARKYDQDPAGLRDQCDYVICCGQDAAKNTTVDEVARDLYNIDHVRTVKETMKNQSPEDRAKYDHYNTMLLDSLLGNE